MGLTWLLDILIGVIATLLGTALIGAWASRGKIWPGLAFLYMSASEAMTIPVALCIEILQNLARLISNIGRSRFSAVFKFQVSVSRSTLRERSVGTPTASAAPTIRISDSEILNTFSATHNELVVECRKRYSNFKQNSRFYKLLESVKKDPNCAHERWLNPNSSKNSIRMFYNLDAVLAKFDDEYTKLK